MNKNNEIKIGDFGISKELNSYKTFTKTNKNLGTLYYTAPEILKNSKYNNKADIWSLGCIIYELFNLDFYFLNNMMHEIKKFDENIYNSKWQKLIDSLLETKYNVRPDINKVIDFIVCEILKESDKNEKNQIVVDKENTTKKMKFENKPKIRNEDNNKDIDNSKNINNINNIININNIFNFPIFYPSFTFMNQNYLYFNPINTNQEKSKTERRLRKEFELCCKDNDLAQIGCSFGLLNADDFYRWKISMFGQEKTPYTKEEFLQ